MVMPRAALTSGEGKVTVQAAGLSGHAES